MTRRRAVALTASALVLSACTLVVDPEVGAGLGTACAVDDQCQGASCIEGICAVACGDSNGCPGGTQCAELLSGNGGSCQLPLRAGFVYAGDPNQFDFVRAFEQGRVATEAVPALAYLSTTVGEPTPLASDAADEARSLAALGNGIVVSTAESHAQAIADVADELGDTLVLAYQSDVSGGNLVSFDARIYQAHFLAGFAAAQVSTGRIGFVAGTISPRSIASVNAFALGAQRKNPAIVVEVRFLGEPHDTQPKVDGKSRERRFVEELVTGGSDVIAHNLDNNIPLFTVRDLLIGDGAGGDPEPNIRAIGQNVADACEQFETIEDGTAEQQAVVDDRCIAGTFYQWDALFTRVFDDVHRDVDVPPVLFEPMLPSNTGSVVGFSVGDAVGVGDGMDLDELRGLVAGDVGFVFGGPIESTRDCAGSPCVEVAEGQTLDDAGIDAMCWLVQGIVGPDDLPLMVPAEGDCAVE
ncbi:MAG: BMP family ABC transporter substrate-binding protein [Myxococcales bacterium]|nr:BMP family ABC transporter substrate-binding protein [Myxococcales bacterium]